MFENPGKTAITRRTLSVPMKWLRSHGFLCTGESILDFGCGRGGDVERLVEQGYDVKGYDPNHRPEMPEGEFSTVTCNYVLNVIDRRTGLDVLRQIRDRLTEGGQAYISVRRDIKADTDSQRVVDGEAEFGLKSIHLKKGSFELYLLDRHTVLG